MCRDWKNARRSGARNERRDCFSPGRYRSKRRARSGTAYVFCLRRSPCPNALIPLCPRVLCGEILILISLLQLGTIDYSTGLQLQQKLVALRKQEKIGDVLLLLEHSPVITLSRNAKA